MGSAERLSWASEPTARCCRRQQGLWQQRRCRLGLQGCCRGWACKSGRVCGAGNLQQAVPPGVSEAAQTAQARGSLTVCYLIDPGGELADGPLLTRVHNHVAVQHQYEVALAWPLLEQAAVDVARLQGRQAVSSASVIRTNEAAAVTTKPANRPPTFAWCGTPLTLSRATYTSCASLPADLQGVMACTCAVD